MFGKKRSVDIHWVLTGALYCLCAALTVVIMVMIIIVILGGGGMFFYNNNNTFYLKAPFKADNLVQMRMNK